MALFKIQKGPAANLGANGNATAVAHEGFAYFTPDDGKFYIDIQDADEAIIGVNRIPINSVKADKFSSDRTITITGSDITGTGTSNGTSGWSIAASLIDRPGLEAGSYGLANNDSPGYSGTFKVPYFTIDTKGRVTAASEYTITLPAAVENSHYITHLYAGTGGVAENSVSTNGNTKLILTDNAAIRNTITLQGSGATNVTSDNNGVITIYSENTWNLLSTSQPGYVPQAPNNSHKFLRGDATWADITTTQSTNLNWNTESTIATIGGYDIKVTLPEPPPIDSAVTLIGDVTGYVDSSNGSSIITTIGNEKVTNGMLEGFITNNKLVNSKITIANIDVPLGGSISLSDLGLSSALRFKGVTTSVITDGRTIADIIINNSSYTPIQGDVILYEDGEYVWTGTAWEEFGRENSFKIKQTAITKPVNTTNKWVSAIGQNVNGDINVSYTSLDTSGAWSGNAATATAANITSTDNAIVRFDGTAGKFQNSNVTIDDNGYINSTQFKTSSSETILNNVGYITIYPYDRNTYGNTTPTPAKFIFTEKAYTTGVPAKTLMAWSGIDNIKVANFIGTLKGNADTATALATARTIQTNLASISAASFNGTENITPGVTGTLGAANGGTGNTSFTKNTLIYAETTAKLSSYTSTKGGTKKLWYLNAGVPTDSNETVGATDKPVFLSSGTITASTSTIGSGVIPIYMTSGQIKASTSTAGTATKPVWLDGGTIKAGTYELKATVDNGTQHYLTMYTTADGRTIGPASNRASTVLLSSTVADTLKLTSSANANYLTYTSSKGTWKAGIGSNVDEYWIYSNTLEYQSLRLDKQYLLLYTNGFQQQTNVTDTKYGGIQLRDTNNAYLGILRSYKSTSNTMGVQLMTYGIDNNASTFAIYRTSTPDTYITWTSGKIYNSIYPWTDTLNIGSNALTWHKFYSSAIIKPQDTVISSSTTIRSHYILAPLGGSYTTSTQTTTGLLKIEFPVRWTGHMINFKVDIYDYSSNNLVTYHIGGYNYKSEARWANTSAYSVGVGNKSNLTVRFCDDGTHVCVTIGETDTAWSYIQINIRDVYIGFTSTSVDDWNNTWRISFVTTQPTISNNQVKTNTALVQNGTVNRLAYYLTTTSVKKTDSIYADDSHITINGTAAPVNSGNFQVIGSSTMRTILPEANATYDIGKADTLRWRNGFFTTALRVGPKDTTTQSTTDGNSYIGPDGFWYDQTKKGTGYGYTLRGCGKDQYAKLYVREFGDVGTTGAARLLLGNTIANTAADNARGEIVLYSNNANTYAYIYADDVTANVSLKAIVDRFEMPKLRITSTADVGGKTSSSPPLSIGTLTSTHIEIDTNKILAKNSDTTTGTLWLQDEDGLTGIGGSKGLYIYTTSQTWLPAHNNSYVGGIRMYPATNSGGAWNWIKQENTHTNISRWWGMGTFGHSWYVVSSASSRGTTAGYDQGILFHGNSGCLELSKDGYLTTGNLTIGGKVDTDPGKTIVSSSTLYLKTSASAPIIFNTNSNNCARFDINGHFIPEATNTYNLGTQGSKRWKALFIGAYDSYGGTTQPIWWNAGVPTAITTAIATAYGGTGNNTFTKNRLIWTSENTKLSSATNLWTDGTTIRFLKEDPNKLYALLQNTYNSTVYDTLVDYQNGNIVLNAASLGLYLGYSNTTYIDFIHGLGRWTNTGLGVGITSPSYKLHVVGTGYFTDTVHINKNSGSGPVDADTAPLLIGKLTGASLAIGNNAIQARSNHITSTLWFNYEGGSASFGSSTSKTVPTTFFGTVTPGANSTYDLGTTDTLRWKSGFFTTSLRVGAINTTATPNSPVNSRSVYIGPDGFYANSVNTTTTTLSNFVLRGKGVNYAKLYISQLGEVNTPGIATLTLGNNIASTADNNSNGTLQLYSNTTKYTSIKSSLEIEASHLNYLPIYGSTSSNTYYGRLVGIYKGTTSGSDGFSDVGSPSQPVYVTANGVVKAITGAIANNTTGNAATASKLTDITTDDAASSSATWRHVWFSYNNNTTGRPAYSSNLVFQTSTNTLKATKFQGALVGNADTATAANITSTDNAIVRFDGTAGVFQNSKALVDDAGGITVGGGYLTIKPYSSTYDTTGSHAGIRFYFNHDRSGYKADTLITNYSLQATNFYGALKGNADTATAANAIKTTLMTNASTAIYVLGATGTTADTSATVYKGYRTSTAKVYFRGDTGVLMGAAWNDYAEYRQAKNDVEIEPGRVVKEVGDETLELTTERLQRGCSIVSNTFGISIGESETNKLPLAVSGRVLAYPYESKEEFKNHIGWPVCSGPSGTVSIMTEEEEMKYPSRIIGTISAVPEYEIWHGGADVIVDGRVWIKVR